MDRPAPLTPAVKRRQPVEMLWLAGIFTLALIVRLVIVRRFGQLPVSDLLWNDAVGWNLANGHGFTASLHAPYVPGIYRTPGHPALLALVYWCFGHSYTAAFIAQAVIDALTAVLLSLVVRHCSTVPVARAAGLLYALYPYPAIYCGFLSQDILLTFAVQLVLFLLTTTATIKQPGVRGQSRDMGRWLALGLAMGFLVLVKAVFILYAIVPLGVVLLSARSRAGKLRATAMLGIGLGVLVAPWVVRNYLAFGSFPPLAAGSTGTNMMYIAESLEGGEQNFVGKLMAKSEVTSPDADRLGWLRDLKDGAALIASEKALAQAARPRIARHWPQYLLFVAQHVPRLWITQYTVGRSAWMGRAGQALSYMILLPGLIGMICLRRQWQRLLPLYLTIIVTTAVYAPYTVEARYTLPARPAMVFFATAALCLLLPQTRRGLLEPGEHSPADVSAKPE